MTAASRTNPSECRHERIQRIGIQRTPGQPRRLYLVNCLLCGTTLTTRTLRDLRGGRRGSARESKEGRAA